MGDILRQRCPRCREGRIFAGMLRMNESCPECGLRFGREPGYFFGAMYFGYALGGALLALLVLALWLTVLSQWPLHWVVLPALLLLLPFLPMIFRYSRVLWIHFDRFFDP